MAPGTSVLLASSLVVLCMPSTGAQEKTTYYLGNAVPGRNMPPVQGCTVTGKIFQPLTPAPLAHPYSTRVGWDWCQEECKFSQVTDFYGSVYPCQHFAFYPDGKCFLGGYNAILEDDHTCNATNPCEHGFQVISGPPDCANKSNWVFPPQASDVPATVAPTTEAPTVAPTTEAPTVAPTAEATTSLVPVVPVTAAVPKKVGKGEKCNGSLPPQYATLCEDGLFCDSNGMPGASGVCAEQQSRDVTVVAPVTVVETPETPTTVTMTLPSTVTMTTPSTPAPPSTSTVTVPPPPAKSTVVGYYYEPHTMLGTVKMNVSDWEACRKVCELNPFCQHFGYWPDGGCHQQGDNVTLVKGSQPVISGPRDLSMRELWPNLEAALVTGAQAPVAPSTPPGGIPAAAALTSSAKSATVVSDAEPEFREGSVSSSGGSGTLGWLFGVLAVLAIGGGLYAAYSMGLFGDKELFVDEDEDSDDDMEAPMGARE